MQTENWFYSLTATCSFKSEQVLTSQSLLFWSVTWGQECVWAQPLLIVQPQTWAPPPGPLPSPPSALLRASLVVVSVHILAYSGFTWSFVPINTSL